MILTVEQRTALFADIQNDPAFADIPNTPDGSGEIALAYNLMANPQFVVWMTRLSTYEIRNILVWTEYEGLSVSRQNAFEFLCSNGTINPAMVNVRDGINSIFTGPNAVGTRTALIEASKRDATRAEKLFASGTGSDASPGVMTFEGRLPWSEVHNSRNM